MAEPIYYLKKRLSPPQILVLLFLGVILTGSFLLMLPISKLKPVSFLDVIFTATSATCVTGLLTVNVAETYTLFGQFVILGLIQIGGLGIIAISTLFMLFLGKSVSIRDSAIFYGSFSSSHKIEFSKLLGYLFALVFGFELVGAIILTSLWYGEMDFYPALFNGVFHSVSAFCNAGISILPNGLYGYEEEPLISVTVMLLIFFGVIGFVSIAEAYERYRRRKTLRTGWSLQSRLIFLYTGILVVAGFIGFLFFEYHHSLSGLPFGKKVLNSLFHSISGRTAGFSTVTIADLNNTTLYMFILLMFIGGAPGSVAGGIKITTFAVLIGLAVSRYKGLEKVHIFNRAVPEDIVSRSISIVFISFSVVTVFLFLLLITESVHSGFESDRHGAFLSVFFETVSANGTVGLSMDVTHRLSDPGKILVNLLMLIGRLGPLTVAMAVASRDTRSSYQLSEENIMVG